MYEKDHPNIEIIYEPVPADTLWTVFASELAAGKGADIQSGWDAIWSMQWVFQDGVAPLSDYLPPERFDQVMVKDTYFFEDKYWMMPLWFVGHTNWVNMTILKDSGVDAIPSNWDELLAACEKIKAKGYNPINTGNLEGWGATNWTTNMMDGNANKISDVMSLFATPEDFRDPKWSDSIRLWRELVDKGYFNEDASTLGYYQGWDLAAQGKAAFWVELSAKCTFLEESFKEIGHELDIMPYFPIKGTGEFAKQANTGAQPVFITSFSEHPQEAADFISFLASTERSLAMYKDSGGRIPANSEFDLASAGLSDLQMKLFDLLGDGKMMFSGVTPTYSLNEGIQAIGQVYVKSVPIDKVIEDFALTVEQNAAQTPELMEGYVKWYESFKAAGK